MVRVGYRYSCEPRGGDDCLRGSSCGTQALVAHGYKHLPNLGIEPTSPALMQILNHSPTGGVKYSFNFVYAILVCLFIYILIMQHSDLAVYPQLRLMFTRKLWVGKGKEGGQC